MITENDRYYQVKGLSSIFNSPEQKGIAKISLFEFNPKDNPLFTLRNLREPPMFAIREGKYVRLSINGQLMMSDTGMERISNKPFIRNAAGHVLIAGLGIGLIIHNILDKPNVRSITVIEKYQDVIDLVSAKFTDSRITYVCVDIFNWKPEKGIKYDTIYFDIWPGICSDNLNEITTLHNRFKSFKSKGGWMNSWMKEFLQKEKRKR